MSESIVAICNSALTKLGSEAILSLDDGTKTADACKLRYESVKRAVLRSHPWNCAVGRVTLAPLTDKPEFGFDNAFQLPSNCLRVLNINSDNQDYKIEGKNLLIDDSAVELRYIKDVSDTTQFDELLSEAIAARLAWDICFKITQSSTLKDSLFKEFRAAIVSAKTPDSQEEPAQELEANYFLESRLAGTDSATPKRSWP